MVIAPVRRVLVYGVSLPRPVGPPAIDLPLTEIALMLAAAFLGPMSPQGCQ